MNGLQAKLGTLQEDEEVLGNVSFYWYGWWAQILAGILLIPVFGLGLVILYLVYRAKAKSGCLITNRRIVYSKGGLLSAETIEVNYEDIRSISTYEGVIRGGVRVNSGAGDISIGVTNPRELANVIREQKNARS